jgi:hypothetical protein
MKELGNKIKCQGMVYTNMQMEPYIEENGKIINIMAKENINFPTVQFIKENGKIISCMVLDIILILKGENGKENTEKVNSNLNCKNN